MSTPRRLCFTVGSSLLTASLTLAGGCDEQESKPPPVNDPAVTNAKPIAEPEPPAERRGDEGPTVNPAPEPAEPVYVNEGPEPMPEPAPDIKVNPGPNPAYDTTAPKPPGQLP